jgi:ATP-dependent RNA helicase RhlE
MNQGFVHLDRVESLILDEADQMLDMGFIHDLRRIVGRVPRERQTLLFSATMPPEIRSLADQWLYDPITVSVTPQATPVERITQSVFFVEQKAKPEFLVRYLKEQSAHRPLVFTRTKHGADKLVKSLAQAGIRAAAIHGNKSQNARQHALAQFKSQHPPVLVATDIAARGLDIDGVSHVVNFDLPMTPESYVHRIGRTGRAGADGIAVTFCAGDERSMLREIERITRQKLPVAGGEPGPEHHHGSREYRAGFGRGGSGRSGGPGKGNRFRFQKRSGSGGPPPHAGFSGKRPQKQRRFSQA